MEDLKLKIRKWMLFLGVLQITIGCIVGFIPPSAVSWYRGIVMAHLEYTANGIMLIALGLLVNELNLGTKALGIWFAALQVGTWTNGTAGVLGAFLGYSSSLMTTINEKFPAPNGLDHGAVTGLLMVCGVTVMIGLLLTLWGLINKKPKGI